MRSVLDFGLLALGTLALVDAQTTHTVDVGNGGLNFNPNSIMAAMGDIVEFHFYPQMHSVAQGSFDKPCSVGSVTNGFYSGYIPSTKGEAAQVFRVTVNTTDPMYFYCSQISHCQNGMVGAINPPSSGNTVAAYLSAAGQTSTSEIPKAVEGGVVGASGGSASSSSSSSSAAASASSSASAASSMASSAASSASSMAMSMASSAASSASSAASSAAATATSASGSATSAASSPSATAKTNAAAVLRRLSYEMLGLAALAGGVAVMMQ